MQIRYVVSTMIFWWRENNLSFEQECDFLRSLGFGVELCPTIRGQTECRYSRRNWERLVNATEGMVVSMRSRRDRPTIEQWREQIECARFLNADIVADLDGLGIPKGKDINGDSFCSEVVSIAQQCGVRICAETGNLKQLLQLAKRFESILYCLDMGYTHIDRENRFTEYVDSLMGRIAHLHLTDNYGSSDDHEPPGLKGGIPRNEWDYLLKALKKQNKDVIGSFEMYPCTPAVMIRQASEFVFGELNWPGKPQRQPGYNGIAYNPV